MKFGERLRNYREDLELTQQQMADLIPMNQSNYSKIERNIQEPSLFQLKRIAEITNKSIDELLGVDSYELIHQRLADYEEELNQVYKKYFKN